MYACNGKQYNLDQLFQFEMLKDILKSLCKNGLEMQTYLKNLDSKLNTHILNSDKKFSTIETNFNNLTKTINNLIEGKPQEGALQLDKFPTPLEPEQIQSPVFDNQQISDSKEYETEKKVITNQQKDTSKVIDTETKEVPYKETNEVPYKETNEIPYKETNEVPQTQTSQIPQKENNKVPQFDTPKKTENEVKDNIVSEQMEPLITPRKNKLQEQLKNIESNPSLNANNFKEALKNIVDDDKEVEDTSKMKINPELITTLLKKIRENHKKISILEKFVNELLESSVQKDKNLKLIREALEEHEDGNNNDFQKLQNSIQDITLKLRRNAIIMEDLQTKTADMDVFNMVKDSGDGNTDASKVLIRALEARINKRFDLNDEKNKNDQLEFMKVKNQVINNGNVINVLQRNYNNVKDDFDNLNNQLGNNVKDLKSKDDDLNKLINDNNDQLNKNINSTKEELEKEIDNKLKEALEQINKQLQSLSGSEVKIDLTNPNASQQELNLLEKKVNDLRRKVNDIDNELRMHLNSKDLDEMKKTLKNIQFDMDNKLVHSDLKELYDHHLSDLDLINDAKDNINFLNDDTKKLFSQSQDLYHKLEILTGHVNALKSQSHENKGLGMIDLSQFIDQERFMQSTKALYRELERLKKQDENMQRAISDLYDTIKNMPTNEQMNLLDNTLNQAFNDLKALCKKTYADKNDVYRSVKTLEIQIRQVAEEQIKRHENGDTWLLAKRPLTLKCASCEADITNTNPKSEYLPWNKYPLRDDVKLKKGPGFSHMLQMISPELIKSYEQKEFSSDNEKFDGQIGSVKNFRSENPNSISAKIKLPKVGKSNIKNLNEEAPPISDEDETTDFNKGGKKDVDSSPKIVKITKFKQFVSGNNTQGNEENSKRKKNLNNVQITIDSSLNNNNFSSNN